MARIRTIKPEFWTSAQVMECSTNARLLFIGMWNFADDHGRMAFSPKTIKAQVFPADAMSIETVQGMLSELSKNGLISNYVVDGKEYLSIDGWHHQRIDKPQKPRYPAPLQDHSKNTPGTFGALSTLTGREKEIDAAIAAPSSKLSLVPDAPAMTAAELEKSFFDRGKKILGGNAGGMLASLLKSKEANVALARAALEVASTKQNPREYVGAIIRGAHDPPGSVAWDPAL